MQNKETANKQIIISGALSRQISWLQTWKTKNEAYNGYVVHREDLKRLYKIHDTPWSQAPLIKGYINLFKNTGNKNFLKNAIAAANLQCKRLNDKTGKYKYAGFEDDRFCSLVHCSLANIALLDLAQVIIKNRLSIESQVYIDCARKNIDLYLIGKLWDKKAGAFKFSEIDYYSPRESRYVANMNSVTVESLIKLYKLTKEEKYLNYGIIAGKWLLSQQVNSNDERNGGIYYSNTHPHRLISIYIALAMEGLDDLYFATGEKQYLNMMINAAKFLIKFRDPDTHLFYHLYNDKALCKYPLFIAGAGLGLRQIYRTEEITKIKFDWETTLASVLKHQLPNGGFSNFVRYNAKDNGRKKGNLMEVWEDVVPVVGWNAHLFEFLTLLAIKDFEYPKTIVTPFAIKKNKTYFYFENKNLVIIIGFFPIKSTSFILIFKKIPFSIIAISFFQIYKAIFCRLKSFLTKFSK